MVTPTPAVTPTPKPTPTSATNTGRNARDAQTGAMTPIDQSNKAEDLKATKDIRQRVMGDKALSLNAKNAKIITTETSVVLRGPVDSKADRDALNRYAKEYAGSRTVLDELEIETAKK
ncbi:MAG: BON domain-containing protein [Verrucomicrobia bacterium]|nr:BON domain-containing protein [Verrucomicrobiota bacterium]